MKFNLKNRPNLEDFRWIWDEMQKAYVDREDEDVTFYLFVKEWFIEFEKELREDLNSFDWEHKKGNHETSTCLICQWLEGRIEMIQEILGEASSADEGSRGG